nr:hypothetical protein DM860_007016 [Ipomoea batatas]
MGDHKSEGLSWADQWDPEPLPAPGEKKGAHKDAGKGTAAKKFLTFQWLLLPNSIPEGRIREKLPLLGVVDVHSSGWPLRKDEGERGRPLSGVAIRPAGVLSFANGAAVLCRTSPENREGNPMLCSVAAMMYYPDRHRRGCRWCWLSPTRKLRRRRDRVAEAHRCFVRPPVLALYTCRLKTTITMEGTAGAHHCCFNDAYCRDPPPELQGCRLMLAGH